MAFIALVYVDDHTADAIRDGDAPWEGSARTVGLFRYPVKADLGCVGHTGWVRDRIGFMKCAECGQRNRRVREFVTRYLFEFLGANHIDNPPAAFRTPEGYGPVRGQ